MGIEVEVEVEVARLPSDRFLNFQIYFNTVY